MKSAVVRKKLGLSQGQYAKLVGMTQSGVSKNELGASRSSGPLQRLNFLFAYNPALAMLVLKAFKTDMPGENPLPTRGKH